MLKVFAKITKAIEKAFPANVVLLAFPLFDRISNFSQRLLAKI